MPSGTVHACCRFAALACSWFACTFSPFKEVEGDDDDASACPKPRQKHFKSKTLGFSLPADADVERRSVTTVRDGKPSAVQALSLREASDCRGVTVHVPKDVVNSMQKDATNSAALDVAARAARDQASTLVKLGLSLPPPRRDIEARIYFNLTFTFFARTAQRSLATMERCIEVFRGFARVMCK